MIQNRCLKLRLYPNKEQFQQMKQTGGCRRFVYNQYVIQRDKFYEENIKKKNLTKEQKKAKYKEFKYKTEKELKQEFPFLKEVSSAALQQARKDAEKAFSDYLSALKEMRQKKLKKPHVGKPQLKKKKNGCRFREVMLPNVLIDENHNWINIPKLGKITFKHDNIPDWFHTPGIQYRNLTVEVNKADECYVSINCQYEQKDVVKHISNDTTKRIGLDFSPAKCYVDSNGNAAPNYVPVKQSAKRHLAHLQRNLSRTKKGSKNREKARVRVAKLENRIANKRRDWIEKETLRLVKNYELIGIETLNLQGMMSFSKNAKNYTDASWYNFTQKLIWKSNFYNCTVVKADKWFASSQICSVCGYQNTNTKNLNVRNWCCPNCNTHHNRDQNAAINLMKYAERTGTAGTVGTYACRGLESEPGSTSLAESSMKQELQYEAHHL